MVLGKHQQYDRRHQQMINVTGPTKVCVFFVAAKSFIAPGAGHADGPGMVVRLFTLISKKTMGACLWRVRGCSGVFAPLPGCSRCSHL